MYKTFAVIVLIAVSCVSARTRLTKIQSSPIEHPSSSSKQTSNAIDWCPQCISSFDDAIDVILDAILQYGVMGTCGDICDFVTTKTGSDILGFICTFGCDVLGLEEFVKLIQKADLDPIYYCESIKICPINDNGDAKFTSFVVLPQRALIGTKIAVDFVYASKNGTGTGELIFALQTVDKIALSQSFLLEAQKPGTYGERVAIDTTPDPSCDPSQGQCEQWLAGTYNVSVTICNGMCGSQHPHTQLYDRATGSFQLIN